MVQNPFSPNQYPSPISIIDLLCKQPSNTISAELKLGIDSQLFCKGFIGSCMCYWSKPVSHSKLRAHWTGDKNTISFKGKGRRLIPFSRKLCHDSRFTFNFFSSINSLNHASCRSLVPLIYVIIYMHVVYVWVIPIYIALGLMQINVEITTKSFGFFY